MRDKTDLKLLGIIVLCFIIYGPSLANGFIWDDDAYVHKNPVLTSPTAVKDIWFSYKTPQYYPLVFTSFLIEHALWGFKPFGYHLVNLLLHIINALLVFTLVRKFSPKLAFFTAVIFAIHPIQVETVAWITERKNLLGLLFFLLATLSYLRFEEKKKKADYIASLALFTCALLSKSVAVCFVAVPLLYQWWKENRITLQKILVTLPFAAIGILSAVNTIYLELYRVGAKWDTWTLAPLGRLILSARILFFYAYKLLVPFRFIFFYPRWQVDAGQWWQWLFLAAAVGLLVFLVKARRRLGRGALALFLFYIISIFPALGFFNVYPMKYSYVADHFSYLSTPALILLLAGAFSRIKTPKPLLPPLFIIMIIFLSVKALSLTASYKDEMTLWLDTVKKNPDAWMAYNNLGILYKDQERIGESMAAYTKAIEINPEYENTYYNLGNLYIHLKQHHKAVEFYQKAIDLNPNYAQCYNNLGNAYKDTGRIDEAIDSYKKAIRLNPHYAMAMSNLGVAYLNKGQRDTAIELFEKAIALDPIYAETYNNLASLYYETKRVKEAIPLYKKAISLKPDYAEAYSNLAVACLTLKRYADAIRYADKAKALGLTNAGLLKALAPYRR